MSKEEKREKIRKEKRKEMRGEEEKRREKRRERKRRGKKKKGETISLCPLYSFISHSILSPIIKLFLFLPCVLLISAFCSVVSVCNFTPASSAYF